MSNKNGFVCYTEGGETVEVTVEASAVTGTFLVRNLRDAVKEKRKHHYATVDADQIPIALRGSTEPLKGDTMLVPKAMYDLLAPPAAAVVALPLAVPVLDRQAAFELGDPYAGMETATQSGCFSAMVVVGSLLKKL